ncbi:MAG: hypothetical protein QG567_2488 [Campylobacterota bacterium]|nr:hypothetical protein [Campylobacterota bacterium]
MFKEIALEAVRQLQLKKVYIQTISKRDFKEIKENIKLEVISAEDMADTVLEVNNKFYYIREAMLCK